jgi:hypothetical protein
MEENKIIEEYEENNSDNKKNGGWKKELFEWIQAIAIALVVSFVLKNFVK